MKLTRTVVGFSIGAVMGTVVVLTVHFTALAKESAPAIHVDSTPINRDPQSGNSYAAVVKKTAPAVVNIYATRTVRYRRMPFMGNPFFEQFFGDPFSEDDREYTRRENWLGSGIIVTSDGYILTANHVAQGADEIKVVLANSKKEYDAKVVGKDPDTDVAVLKIDAQNLPAVTLGDSDQLEVGDVVLAIGNPFGVGQSVTKGIVSALGRSLFDPDDPDSEQGARYQDFIQTDAAINKGNSGGALVDTEGRLIGINDAIASPNGGSVGLGFAVPINLARNVMERLINGGRVTHGYLGVGPQDLDAGLAQGFNLSGQSGALVAEVEPDSPAAKAGIQSGDIILAVNGKKISGAENLDVTISQLAPGAEVNLRIFHNGRVKNLTAKLTERPDDITRSQEDQNLNSDNSAKDALEGGVTVQDLNPQLRRWLQVPTGLHGALVTEVDQDSNFADAGLSKYDVIVEVNRQPVANADAAMNLYKAAKGDQILLKIWRPAIGGMRYLSVDNTAQK